MQCFPVPITVNRSLSGLKQGDIKYIQGMRPEDQDWEILLYSVNRQWTYQRLSAWPWLSPGEAWIKCLLYFAHPHLAGGSVTPQSKSHHQSVYPLNLALVLIYVYWHAISCSITFTCQNVYQGGLGMMGGNSIWITFCPHRLVYLHGAGDSGWAEDIMPGISCAVKSVLWILVHHIGKCRILMRFGFTDKIISGTNDLYSAFLPGHW